MNSKKIRLLVMHDKDADSSETGRSALSNIESRCKPLCESLSLDFELSVLSSSSDVAGEIQALSLSTDALIVSNEGFAGSPDGIAVEELRSFEAVAERGIPIVEVIEQNVFTDHDSRPYLDSPGIGAGLVSGMGLDSYALAIRALASTMGSESK